MVKTLIEFLNSARQIKVSYLRILLLPLLLFLFVRCVESVSSEPQTGSVTVSGTPSVSILYPALGDSIKMGKNVIQYQASDVIGGTGLYAVSVFLGITGRDPIEFQNFPVTEDGENPEVYIHTDSIESKFDLVPGSFPSRVKYWLTIYSGTRNVAPKASKIQDSVYVDRRPEAPQDVVLIRNSSTSFTIFWTDVASNETEYELWRKDGENGGYIKLNHDIPADNISVFDFVNSSFITYYYRVRARNQYGVSSFSNEVSSALVAGGNQPTNLRAEALGASKVKLTWVDNSADELGFKIERTNPLTGVYEQITGVTSNTQEFIDGNLTPGTTYKYRVASFTSKAQSAWSNEATVTTYTMDVAPPFDLQANFIREENYVLITWVDPTTEEKGAFIERKTGLTGDFLEIGQVDVDNTQFIDESVTPNTLYSYRARYVTSIGFRTEYSNTDTVFVPIAGPKSPSDLTIQKFTDLSGNVLYGLRWSDNADDEDGYEIERSDNGTIYTYYDEVGQNGFAYNDNPVTPPVYWYRVRGFRLVDGIRIYSKYSNVVNTDGSGSNLPKPNISLTQTYSGGGYIQQTKVSWTYSHADALGFIVERKLSTESVFQEMEVIGVNEYVSLNNYVYEDNTVIYGATYVYRLKAYSSTEVSAYSDEKIIFIRTQ
ncbi:MAG: fibronectin type III domain-containing protein [Melioribacteraceae bacterium]|nr:fibronectin type III domain-containing protein [Melioribacteraceae bacterium]